MNDKQRASVRAIFQEAEKTHGAVFRGAVDTLASTATLYAHAITHCEELAGDLQIVGYSAVTRILDAAGLLHLKDAVCDFANRVIGAYHADMPAEENDPSEDADAFLRKMGAVPGNGTKH